jgi:uncharacterized protein DUF3710
VIFRRRKGEVAESDESAPDADGGGDEAFSGPYDFDEVDLDPADETRVDLGGLIVAGQPDVGLELQIDEESQVVAAVLLVSGTSALELRPFAAPRRGGLWAEIRQEIAAEATRMGGTATPVEGEFGTELKLALPLVDPAGQPVSQLSRVVGVDGPRWFLRGTFLGEAAADPQSAPSLTQAFRDVVVVRGSTPMAPREPIPLGVPSGAELPDLPSAD